MRIVLRVSHDLIWGVMTVTAIVLTAFLLYVAYGQ